MGAILWLLGAAGAALAQATPVDDAGTPDETVVPEGLDVSRVPSVQGPAAPRWRLGGALGLGLPMDDTGITPVLQLSGSWAIPAWDRRIRPVISVGGARPATEETIEDVRLPEALHYTTRIQALLLGAGVEVALLPGAISPCILVSPQLSLSQTVTDSTIGDTTLARQREGRSSLGWLAGAGVSSPLGPGEIVGGVRYLHLRVGGLAAGDSPTRAITPTVEYRWTWTPPDRTGRPQ